MTGRLRAGVRLLRCTVHAVHGVLLVLVHFRRFDAAERHEKVRWWSQKLLRLIGVRWQVQYVPSVDTGAGAGAGATGVDPAREGRLIAANHVSWLDMSAIHAVFPQARFVSKAAVKGWPLLSQLADAGGTLYLERERKRDALRVVQLMAASLAAGGTVAVFPEGTTSDGRGLLPFHANLLQAAIASAVPVQPLALRYADASDDPSRAVEFVGETLLLQSMWRIARADALTVQVTVLPMLSSAGAERRALSARVQARIAGALACDQPLP